MVGAFAVQIAIVTRSVSEANCSTLLAYASGYDGTMNILG
jgi:hypothetical protein